MTISTGREKGAEAYRTISEVAEALKLPQHVLRFWETRFVQIKPMKRGGNRRYYRPEDVELLAAIRQLLYGEGYTIKGVQRLLREHGPRAVAVLARDGGEVASSRSATAADNGTASSSGPTAGPGSADTMGNGAARSTGEAPETAAFPGDPVSRLRAVLASLSDCRRILDAARD